ncbi:hypothetical protein M409DRAFT_53963 [Zasmidium cellare ATCC 36951]|uniref:Uncharacterized protein n=1 Tax=Zasmidium cellare ATCC 36951 TaxID=1080233 RepID=A0A6A6CJE6_ZASCE|nr:uncharacterized protein M409DRAFT_53963 [Zasmidium cellare ATCC 36951]KAF2167357.1 hypothetical protein M409DRAFT_53963 [Zasmidium cellare ATCC 36951]
MATHTQAWSIWALGHNGINGWTRIASTANNATRFHLIFTGDVAADEENLGIDFARINGSTALNINSLAQEFHNATALRIQLGNVLTRIKEDVVGLDWQSDVTMEMCFTDHEHKQALGLAGNDGVTIGTVPRLIEQKGRWVRVVQNAWTGRGWPTSTTPRTRGYETRRPAFSNYQQPQSTARSAAAPPPRASSRASIAGSISRPTYRWRRLSSSMQALIQSPRYTTTAMNPGCSPSRTTSGCSVCSMTCLTTSSTRSTSWSITSMLQTLTMTTERRRPGTRLPPTAYQSGKYSVNAQLVHRDTEEVTRLVDSIRESGCNDINPDDDDSLLPAAGNDKMWDGVVAVNEAEQDQFDDVDQNTVENLSPIRREKPTTYGRLWKKRIHRRHAADASSNCKQIAGRRGGCYHLIAKHAFATGGSLFLNQTDGLQTMLTVAAKGITNFHRANNTLRGCTPGLIDLTLPPTTAGVRERSASGHRPNKNDFISQTDLRSFTNSYFNLRRQISPTGKVTLTAYDLFTPDLIADSDFALTNSDTSVPGNVHPPPFARLPAKLPATFPCLAADVTKTRSLLSLEAKDYRSRGGVTSAVDGVWRRRK